MPIACKPSPAGSTQIVSIYRLNSWSRIKVTLDMFRMLCLSVRANPRFIDLIRGMRSRIGPGDEHFINCYYSIDDHENVQGDSTQAHRSPVTDLGYAFHLRSLSSAIANNREYLENISQQLLSLDIRTAFHKPVLQLNVDVATSQDVYSIRRKLHHFKTILDGTQRIVTALSSLAQSIRKQAGVTRSAEHAFRRELNSISRELDAYQSTASELLDHSADMGSTINSIINFRNQGILASNGAQLHRLAEDNALETKAMAEMGQRTCTDSRTTRIATIIALIYLPANLVITFFSTVFVDIRSPASASMGTSSTAGQDGPQLLIYKQIWIFPLQVHPSLNPMESSFSVHSNTMSLFVSSYLASFSVDVIPPEPEGLGIPEPESNNDRSHENLIRFLQHAQALDVKILPLVWEPGLDQLGLDGATGRVDQSPMNAKMEFAFKRFNRSVKNASDARVLQRQYEAMINEITILSNPSMEKQGFINMLIGVTFEFLAATGQVLPVLVFPKFNQGDLGSFMARRPDLDSQTRLAMCGVIANAMAHLHSCSKLYGPARFVD
ncbi:uncharacterized protein J7T54_008515 [Emericellopsis cladophorae]|uniref:Protein kinase domain-containing protein n=1 Tax=Emericellopsis cladophorae TaxID=2686198 RepID=A0A9P9XZ90_9HYPO|nr:uncharacterized protein J7T54_008515 [Emericellopsis cladophorae]KAI6780597.1 hypothetical protein J7T54_008515 [Emericellopsis cladophorae]